MSRIRSASKSNPTQLVRFAGPGYQVITCNSYLPKIKRHKISKCNCRNVEPGTFRNLDSLTALNLERNIIQKFSAGVFEGVTDTLSSLSLLNNLLTEYPIAAINSLKELRVSEMKLLNIIWSDKNCIIFTNLGIL